MGEPTPGELLRGKRPAYGSDAGRRMGERRSLPRACPVLDTGVNNVMGKLRDVKRPACSEWQTGACRSCGLAVSQPCRRA